jgi:hypothetical protein
MPRSDVPCSGCGKAMKRGRGSLPAGQATCHSCRRARAIPPRPRSIVACIICERPFPQRRADQRYCTAECHGRRDRRSQNRKARDRQPYGSEHQKRRQELLPLAYGTPCPICGDLMGRDQLLDLDHSIPLSIDPNQQAGDRITHAACNRAGKPVYDHTAIGSRTPRSCEICGAIYLPHHRRQQACSRACGVEIRRRNAPPKQPKVATARQPQPCKECGEMFTPHAGQTLCGTACRDERQRSHAREWYRRSGRWQGRRDYERAMDHLERLRGTAS